MPYLFRLSHLGALLAAAIILAACAAPAALAAAPAPAAVKTDAIATEEAMTDEAMSEEPMAEELAMERAAWQSIPLTDARSGATFTLADYAGKTVFVEPFATWCSNCRQQLANVHAARQQASEDVVSMALSVKANIGDEALAAYAADTGYDLLFAAMPPEMLQVLAAQFGQTVSNPPATPHFVIRPDGSTGELVTGVEPTEAILAQVTAAAAH